ncbi:MAG: FimB/Mfa2 family fimbrial subunit [Bacteroidaceae bacterium]|nr:FimB/Mfa2 family fimbrial subunit [Bacteroidaceae bacterium]
MKTKIALMGLLGFLAMQSCSETLIDREVTDGGVTLTLKLASIEQMPFTKVVNCMTKGITSPVGICSKISFAVYSYEGDALTKKQENQDFGSEGFGCATFNLEEGTYRVIVIAHGGDSNPTMTNPSKITFSNKDGLKTTDTFLYSADVDITKDTRELNLDLKRVVAMFQIRLDDEDLPEGVKQLRFDYTGGSSTIDGMTGLGCVNSKQSETLDCQPGTMEYGVYTFIRSDSNTLKVKVSALDGSGAVLKEMELQDVPITCNYITRYTGKMFANEILTSAFSVTLNGEWAGTNDYTF